MELVAKQVKNTPKPSTPQSLTFLTFVKNIVFNSAQDTRQRLNMQKPTLVDNPPFLYNVYTRFARLNHGIMQIR